MYQEKAPAKPPESTVIKIAFNREKTMKVIKEKEEDKYLGDIISKDGRNIKNIQVRVNKGKGIIRKILNILKGIPFGKLFYEISILEMFP